MNNGNDYGKKADIETKVKEYKTPTGNSMMAMIMVQRNQMEKNTYLEIEVKDWQVLELQKQKRRKNSFILEQYDGND